MRDSFLRRMSTEISAQENPKFDFGIFVGDTEPTGRWSVSESVGNVRLGKMNLSGKRKSFQYSRSASPIGISVYRSSNPRQTMPSALRFAWMPPILEKMRRQWSRASEVVQNTSFIGGADVDEVISSHISCKSLLFTSCRSWFFRALASRGRSLISVSGPEGFALGGMSAFGLPIRE